MGWRSHGRRSLPLWGTCLYPHCPNPFRDAARSSPSWLRASVGRCSNSVCLCSPINPTTDGSAPIALFPSAASRFGSWVPDLPGFARKMSSFGCSGGEVRLTRGAAGGNATSAEVAGMVELIRGEGDDMESRLTQMRLLLSRALVSEVLLALNSHGSSALRFFDWVVEAQPDFRTDSGIYNLVVDNLGRLHDYRRMLVMLRELSRGGHCLTEKAFTFLAFNSSVTAKDSIRRVVEVLNMSGGSCRGSGIYSLIKLFCDLGSFELAVFVMEETARKTSYYNVLIAAKCRNGHFQDVYDLFDEMRRQGCDLTTKSYNYLLGSLFKNDKVAEACELLESMEELGYRPDSVTFEVVIFHACRVKRMDFAVEFLGRMLSDGIEPRFTTHAAFIKGYFWSGRAADAHKYVVDMSERDKCSANMNYSLLVNLFRVSGRVIEAGALLFEMMEKNLKPNFPAYVRVMKDLYKMGRRDLAANLKNMFSKFYHSKIS